MRAMRKMRMKRIYRNRYFVRMSPIMRIIRSQRARCAQSECDASDAHEIRIIRKTRILRIYSATENNSYVLAEHRKGSSNLHIAVKKLWLNKRLETNRNHNRWRRMTSIVGAPTSS